MSISGFAIEATAADAEVLEMSGAASASHAQVAPSPESSAAAGVGAHSPSPLAEPPHPVTRENPYSILFRAFDRAFKSGAVTDLETTQESLRELGIIGGEEKPSGLFRSKVEFTIVLSVRESSHAIYSADKIEYRDRNRESYRRLANTNTSENHHIFLKLLELDQAQDESDRKKVYSLIRQIYSKKRALFSSLDNMGNTLIKQDITLGIKTILDEYKARTLSEKLWGLSGMIIKIPAGIVSIWSGCAQLSSAYTSAYCLEDKLPTYYSLNTTIAAIPQGPFNLTCLPEIVTNGTITPPHCLGSKMVYCETLSPSKYVPGVALIVGGAASLASGIWDLFGSPQIYTDIKTWWNKESRESGILFDQKALINTIHAAVIKVEDISRHEELIKDALSLTKALLPRSGHVDVVQKVKDSLKERTCVILGSL